MDTHDHHDLLLSVYLAYDPSMVQQVEHASLPDDNSEMLLSETDQLKYNSLVQLLRQKAKM